MGLEHGGARAALDFAPASAVSGCVPSLEWVTAVAAGKMCAPARAQFFWIWTAMAANPQLGHPVLHIADEGKVQVGAYVEPGDRIGHPSCEGAPLPARMFTSRANITASGFRRTR